MDIPKDTPALVTTALVVVAVVSPSLSLVSIYLRYKSRRISRQPIKSDDYWIVVSWIFALSLSITVWAFAGIAGINHYKINPAKGVESSLKCVMITSLLVQLPLSAVKIALLLFYKRVFTTPKFRLAVQITMPFVLAWGVIFSVLTLLQCDPISACWTIRDQFDQRWDATALSLAQIGTSIVLDVIVLCFPIPVILGLHMQTSRKIAIIMIFWLGGFCCIAAIVRLILVNESTREVEHSYSTINVETKATVFKIIEPNCSIIAACLPCYGPLFAKGRNPESIISSVRSAISFRIRNSSTARGKSSVATTHDGGSTGSQVELREAAKVWPSRDRHGTNVSRVETGKDQLRDKHQDGILVKTAYDVERVSRDEESLT